VRGKGGGGIKRRQGKRERKDQRNCDIHKKFAEERQEKKCRVINGVH